MAPRIAMILGRTIWSRDGGGWRHEALDERAGAAHNSVARFAEVLSAAPAERTIAVFEPDGMAHQTVETPKVNRAAFSTLARVRNEHPVVESENLGWGIEYPDSGPGGTFSTLIHSELTPGLVHVLDTCVRAGCRFSAAWSAYTVAVACTKSGRSASKARYVLILITGFAAIAAFGGGKRSFKTWVGPMTERDWKAFSALLGDFDASMSPSMTEAGLKRGTVLVIADGALETSCPIWKDLRASGRVEAVVDLEVFALTAARIPVTHPANLIEAFPRPRELDRLLIAGAITGFSAAAVLSAITLSDGRQLRAEGEANRERAVKLEVRLNHLSDNQREMVRLRKEAPDIPGAMPVGRHNALLGLAAVIPDALTLTSLVIGRDGVFELEALVVGGDFELEDTRRALERCGFVPDREKGWAYDARAGRLRVRGQYGEAQP